MKNFAFTALALALIGYWYSPVFRQTQDSNKSDEKTYDANEVDRKVSILSKPEPTYTEEALRRHVVGVVELAAVFAGNGQIKNIEVRKGLPAGLTENAIAVARRITFKPASKNDHPVSQRVTIKYQFTLLERIIHGQQFPKIYYDESCPDYSNIAPNNMVFFTSEKEAKKAGFKKSKTCP